MFFKKLTKSKILKNFVDKAKNSSIGAIFSSFNLFLALFFIQDNRYLEPTATLPSDLY
jgi:hypothetical protein